MKAENIATIAILAFLVGFLAGAIYAKPIITKRWQTSACETGHGEWTAAREFKWKVGCK